MRTLDRYLVGQLTAPLVFAFAAMTSFMLLNQVARRFGQLVGKGLPWSVIGEVFLLCLPFIIAMTVPMAVLIAVLFAFSHLAADSEITAMRASGVSVWQMVRSVLLAGTLVAAVNFWFTDQVLPRSNARLRNLLINIQRKKPTFQMEEQVINEIPQSGLFIRAGRIFPEDGRLRDITIYDLGGPETRRIIYADSGRMASDSGATDLALFLFDGSIHAYKTADPQIMQVTSFHGNQVRIKGVSNRLDLAASDGYRGDREMSTCEMMAIVWEADHEGVQADRRRSELVDQDLDQLLGLSLARPRSPPPPNHRRGYCRWLQEAGAWLGPKPAEAQTPSPSAGGSPAVGGVAGRDSLLRLKLQQAAAARAGEQRPEISRPVVPPAGASREPFRPGQDPRLSSWSDVSAARDQQRAAELRSDQYLVEVHKKWAISAACIVFVIVGVPMALRFPRGGMGLVIGGGLAVFAVYYVGLIAGEGLANKGIVSPATAMWSPNAVMLTLGLIGLWRVSRESGTTRGGDLTDLRDVLLGLLRWRWSR